MYIIYIVIYFLTQFDADLPIIIRKTYTVSVFNEKEIQSFAVIVKIGSLISGKLFWQMLRDSWNVVFCLNPLPEVQNQKRKELLNHERKEKKLLNQVFLFFHTLLNTPQQTSQLLEKLQVRMRRGSEEQKPGGKN